MINFDKLESYSQLPQLNWKDQFINLIDYSNSPAASFPEAAKRFEQLQQSCPFRLYYDFVIEDPNKGEDFYKMAEIKGQKAFLCVAPIKSCSCEFDAAMKDGYRRKSTMNEPGDPVYEERIFIDHSQIVHAEITVLYVQNHKQELFACLNKVYQEGGKWHWLNLYLYGEPYSPDEVREKEVTFDTMLEFMDKPEFQETYQGLIPY